MPEQSPFRDVIIPNLDGSYPDSVHAVSTEPRPDSPFSNIRIPNTDGSYPDDALDGAKVSAEPLEILPSDEHDEHFTDSPTSMFEQQAAELASRLERVDTSGAADIPAERRMLFRDDPERYYTKTLSYDEIARSGNGWKLHLNFDAQNATTVQTVRTFLEALARHGAITTFKIGHGGGKADDAPGKESTVYIGHRDKAKMVALQIDRSLASVLEAPEGDALKDDIPFASRVMGRFAVNRLDSQFHQYGAKGHPILNQHMGVRLFRHITY